MNKREVESFRDDLNKALSQLSSKYNMEFSVSKISYNDVIIKTSIKGNILDENGEKDLGHSADVIANEYNYYGVFQNWKELSANDLLNRILKSKNLRLKFNGAIDKAKKYRVEMKDVNTGTCYKISFDELHNLLRS